MMPLHVEHRRPPCIVVAHPVADLQPGREGLGQRRGIQPRKPVPGRIAQDAGLRLRRPRFVTELPIRRILDHRHHAILGAQGLGQPPLLHRVQRASAGIGKPAHKIHRLHPFAFPLRPQTGQQHPQSSEIQTATRIHRQRFRLHPQAAQKLQKHKVTRPVHQHDIPRLTEGLHRQIQGLLRPISHKNTVRPTPHLLGVGPQRIPAILGQHSRSQDGAQPRPARVGTIL